MGTDVKTKDHKYSRLENALKNILTKYTLPLIMGTVVMKIIISAYVSKNDVVWYIGAFLYEAVLFWIFEKIKPRKILRVVVYLFMMLAVGVLSMLFIKIGYDTNSVVITDWFYLDSAEVGENLYYVAGLFSFIGFFLTSIIYYFSIIRYRTFGMMLVTIFPFAIYGKRGEQVTTFDTTLMLTILIALMVHNRLMSDEKKYRVVLNFSYVITVALFVTFIGAVTMLLPKPSVQSKLEQNTDFFSFGNSKISASAYDRLNDRSSPRFGANSTGEILFYVSSSSPSDETLFLKNHSFDVFKNDTWVDNGNTSKLRENNYYDFVRADNQFQFMKKLAEKGKYSKYGLTSKLFKNDIYNDRENLHIHSESFAPTYLPAPNMSNIDSDNYIDKGNYILRKSGYRRSGIDASFSFTEEGDGEQRYAYDLPFGWDKYMYMLDEMRSNNDIDSELESYIKTIYNDYTSVSDYSTEMYNLAHQITDGKKNDFQKAFALVQYFELNDFTYDMDYQPPDESIDYFLFKSKTGSCTSYATAMTLMARIVGLPARYVEGFAVGEKDDNDDFVVRDNCAHAFVEVYISGVGWMTFDPTVPGYMNITQSTGTNNVTQAIQIFVNYFSKIVLFLAVVFVVIFVILLDRIIEIGFRFMLMFKNNSDKILKLYRRTLKLLENSSKENLGGMTPEQLCTYAFEKRNADISPLVKLFEKVCFGEYFPDNTECSEVYRIYKSNWKAVAGKKKHKKHGKNSHELVN